MEDDKRKISAAMEEEEEIDLGLLLRGMWKSCKRFWWVVLLLTALGAGGLTAWQRLRYQPLYRSSATFTVATADSGSGTYGFYYDSTMADQMSKTFPYILDSSFFGSALLEQLGEDTLNGTITAETIESSNVVTVTAVSPSAEDARRILDAALEIYPETARFVLGEISFSYLNEPETPTAPYNQPSLRRSLGYGGGAGLLVSLVFLGLVSLARKTARNPEEMQKVTSLRCLAAIPEVSTKARRAKKDGGVFVWEKRTSGGYRESLRALGIRVEKEMKKQGAKILLVTSTAAGEGKSTVAMNLASVLAEKGKQVLLADGDLRKQEDAALLGIRENSGLTDVAAEGRQTIRLHRAGNTGFWFLGNSASVEQPAPLLSSAVLRRFLQNMREKMDYVILDTPPAGLFQDAALLAEEADAVLYVVKYDFMPQQRIREGLSALQGKKAGFLGYVFNGYPEASGEYGYGRYGYGYRKYGYGKYGNRAGGEAE